MRTTTGRRGARAALMTVVLLLGALGASMVLWQAGAAAQVDPYSSGSPTTSPSVLPTLIETTQPGTPSPDDTVLPTRLTNPPTPEDDETLVLGNRQPNNTLPFTGADVTLFVATGLAAIATGAVLVRRSRARRTEN